MLRRLHEFDKAAFPVGLVRQTIENGDPSDDRVWLAKANLALASGQHDEAAGLLGDCMKQRPDDQTLAHLALDLAVATGDPGAARSALSKLSIEAISSSELSRLRAWFAEMGPDRELEKQVSLALVRDDPGHTAAWDRLAELAYLKGKSTEAEEFRRKKAEANSARARYEELLKAEPLEASPVTLAGLARLVGCPFEARGWEEIAKGTGSRSSIEPRYPPTATLRDSFVDLHLPLGKWASRRLETGGGSIAFRDDTEAAGLKFLYDNGHVDGRHRPPPEAMGGGVGLLDYDSDGYIDIYLVQGGPFPLVPDANTRETSSSATEATEPLKTSPRSRDWPPFLAAMATA